MSGSSDPICVCGGRRYRTLRRIVARDEDADLPADANETFTIAECTGCGLARTLPPPDPEQYREGYAPTTRDARFAGRLDDAWSAHVARHVRDHATGGSLLDVGCGAGNLVAAAEELGFRAEGIDIDPVATQAGERHGRNVRAASVEQVDGPYDVVVVNHVLEHVADLETFLGNVTRVLAPGGRFFVFSPNHRGLIARVRGDRWMGWVPREHFWHFTPGTLVSTVRRANSLSLVRCTSQGVIEAPVSGVRGIALAALTRASRGRGDQVEGVFERRD